MHAARSSGPHTTTIATHAWERFAALRRSYASHLNALAGFFQVPTLHWVGPQSIIESIHMREQMSPEILERIDRIQKP